MGFPRFCALAEHGLLVEFGAEIAEAIHARVRALDAALAADPPAGMIETVPAYAGLLIRFDPLVTDHAAVEAAARARLAAPPPVARAAAPRAVEVCYEGDLAPDLAEVAARTGLTPEAVIAAHLAGEYRVYMYGFAPGYAYLAGVPAALQLPRKTAAQRDIPAGSVLIAGPQCLVSTLKMPTGWWIIGRSPTEILTDDPARPFLFEVGEAVRFTRLTRAEFDARGAAR